MTSNRILSFPINTTDRFSHYRLSIAYCLEDRKYLVLNHIDRFTYYSIDSKWDKLYITIAIIKLDYINIIPCKCTMLN